AITEWINLGEVYPPAKEALESIQNENRRALEEGSLDFSQFHEFASINERLGRFDLTCSVFAAIAKREPEFAKKCVYTALSALVRTGQFALALQSFDSPSLDNALTSFANFLNQRDRSEPYDDTWIGLYAKFVRLRASVFEGVGEIEEARILQARAIAA